MGIWKQPISAHLGLWECSSNENLNEIPKTDGTNSFKDLLIKTQCSRAGLIKGYENFEVSRWKTCIRNLTVIDPESPLSWGLFSTTNEVF